MTNMTSEKQWSLSATLTEANHYHRLGNYVQAKALYQQILAQQPTHATAQANLASVLQQLGDLPQALKTIDLALAQHPHHGDFNYNKAVILEALQRYHTAIKFYQIALKANPKDEMSIAGIGLCLQELGLYEQSKQYYLSALQINPQAKTYANLGTLYSELMHYEDARLCYEKALALAPDNAMFYYNLSFLEKNHQQLPLAKIHSKKAVTLDPDNGRALYLYTAICERLHDWTNRDSRMATLKQIIYEEVETNTVETPTPLPQFSHAYTPDIQYAINCAYAEKIATRMLPWRKKCAFTTGQRAAHQRIRIGYLSNNFRDHATGQSLFQLFAAHDREKFEVFAYSYGQDDQSLYRKTIESSVEHFIDITSDSVQAAAQRIYADEIDILVDFVGHNSGNRFEIFCLKPAPLQVSYHVFPSTTGSVFMDYFFGDDIVSPLSDAKYYTEKLVLLPYSYRLLSKEPIPRLSQSRQDHGLPENAIVFCSFNSDYKIEPTIFSIWMDILQAVPNSVLWLLSEYQEQEDNLRQTAKTFGIMPQRLIFGKKMPKAEHLARHQHADLFLDSYYINAHTTAADAMWAGLPVLTCASHEFIGRVSASILRAAGMTELIAPSLAAYRQMAIELATDPDKLTTLRRRLLANHQHAILFDLKRAVNNVEKAYCQIWAHHQCGNAPRHMIIQDSTVEEQS